MSAALNSKAYALFLWYEKKILCKISPSIEKCLSLKSEKHNWNGLWFLYDFKLSIGDTKCLSLPVKKDPAKGFVMDNVTEYSLNLVFRILKLNTASQLSIESATNVPNHLACVHV